MSGYTIEEKVEIAGRHLLPKQLEQHGINGDTLHITSEALSQIGQ